MTNADVTGLAPLNGRKEKMHGIKLIATWLLGILAGWCFIVGLFVIIEWVVTLGGHF